MVPIQTKHPQRPFWILSILMYIYVRIHYSYICILFCRSCEHYKYLWIYNVTLTTEYNTYMKSLYSLHFFVIQCASAFNGGTCSPIYLIIIIVYEQHIYTDIIMWWAACNTRTLPTIPRMAYFRCRRHRYIPIHSLYTYCNSSSSAAAQ